MFNKVFYTIVIITFIFFSVGFFLPKTVHVERAVDIQRPAATVFTLVNSFRSFSAWSPWLQRDPDLDLVISGPQSGKGARMTWRGDPRLVGAGTQEIIESTPWTLVRTRMKIEQMGEAESYFQIIRTSDGVRLVRGFDANLVENLGFFAGLLNRYFGLFFDRWIGGDYEQGLARIKVLAESIPAADFSGLEVEQVQVEPQAILYVAFGDRDSGENLTAKLSGAYREITAFMAENSMDMASQPMAITRHGDPGPYEFLAAIPVESTGVPLSGDVRAGVSPAGVA
ncbi:MAG: SRPBCC family protein, partial [Gammaproteobacteria bacterium]|nr:SRPBCC family protein [Gammaproteobacteria bacterium]